MRMIELGDVAELIMGQSPPGDTYNTTGNGWPFFQGKTEFGKVSPIAVKWCTEPKKIAQHGDILISVRAPVGPTNLANQECCIGRGLAAIRATSVERDFLWLFLQYSENILAAKGQGSTFEAINGDDLKTLQVPNYPIEKQRQIAARLKAQLAEVDKARQAAETQLRDADVLGQRIFNKIWAELDSVPRKPLGEYAQTTSGSTPARSNKQYWQPAEVAWVKTAEVAFAPITKTEEAISKKALAECSLPILPTKTVLIAMYGQGKTRGQSAILEIPATTNQACFAILPNDAWVPEFLFHWLKFSYQDLRALSEGRGGNQANLNGGLLKALLIPTPDKPTQKVIIARIENVLTEIEANKNGSKAMLNDINLLPQKILAQAFEM
jgi:type I restriction enzyme S subunit